MGVNRTIDITSEEREVILNLLQRHLPGVEAWVYGSRAKWTSRPQSDLDLVVFTTPEQSPKIGDLREAFEESNLSFRVDLFVWHEVPEQFHQEIKRNHGVLATGNGRTLGRRYSGVSKEWVRRRIGTLGQVVTGKTPSTAERSNFDGPYPFITIPDLDGRVLIDNTKKTLSEKGAAALRTCLLPSGAVLMSCIATVGKCGVTTRPSFTNQQINSVVPRGDLDSRFLYYVFTQLGHELESAGGGGTVYTNVSKGRFSDIEVVVPVDLPEQRAIAHILGTLDDKIELNRRMNETLEAMAQTLFKSWFVDFDPVRAKMTLNHSREPSPSLPPRGGVTSRDSGCGGGYHSPLEGESHSAKRMWWGEQPPKSADSRWEKVKRSYPEKTLNRAKSLRHSQTDAEGLLWHYLRNKQLDGYKFRRQQPIGPYIIDFACLPEKLLIELDGGQHAEQETYDEQRDQFLKDKGYQVLRFWNNEAFDNCFAVLEQIYQALNHSPLEGESNPQSGFGGGNNEQAPETDIPPPALRRANALVSPTPPQGGSDWTVERARAYLDRMDPEIADLFPDRLVDSEIGEIPEGWEVETVGNHVKITKGRSYKSVELEESNTALVTLKSFIRGGGYKEDGVKEYTGPYKPEQIIEPGELIIALTDVTQAAEIIGKPAIVTPNNVYTTLIASLDVAILRPNEPVMKEFFYGLMNTYRFHRYAESFATGTTVLHLNSKGITTFEFALPDIQLCKVYSDITKLMLRKHEENTHLSRNLEALRDTLLPKLISGELRVDDKIDVEVVV